MAALTPRQAAERLGVSVDHVRALIAHKMLNASNIGRGKKLPRWRIDEAEVEDFIQRRKIGLGVSRNRDQSREPKQYV